MTYPSCTLFLRAGEASCHTNAPAAGPPVLAEDDIEHVVHIVEVVARVVSRRPVRPPELREQDRLIQPVLGVVDVGLDP